MELDDARVPGEGDLRILLGALSHDGGCSQLVAAVDHGDGAGEAGQEGRLLHRRVPTADDHDVLVFEEEPVAGGAVGHTVTGEALLPIDAQVPVLRTGGDDDAASFVDAVGGGDALDAALQFETGDVLVADLGAKALGLLLHLVHKLGAHDSLDEAGVVLHLGGVHQGAARGHRTGQDDWAELGAGRIDSCRVAGGAGSDNDDVVNHDSPDRRAMAALRGHPVQLVIN